MTSSRIFQNIIYLYINIYPSLGDPKFLVVRFDDDRDPSSGKAVSRKVPRSHMIHRMDIDYDTYGYYMGTSVV